MNERIRLLAEQAGSTHKQNLGVYQFYSDELEKFAQLIIADAIESIRVMTVRTDTIVPYAKCHLSGMEISQRLIKEHFGVES